MGAGLFKTIKGICPYVIFFGVFVIVMLCLQCFVPFIQRMAAGGYNGTILWISSVINYNFNLPIEMISNFWAAISATYVGLDRASFTIDALKTGYNTEAFDSEKLNQLKKVMWMSFVIFVVAILLYSFFDAELALTPLGVSFGSCMLVFVGGNKAIRTSQHVKKKDKNMVDILIDGLSEDQIITLGKFSKILAESDDITMRIKDGKVVAQKLI